MDTNRKILIALGILIVTACIVVAIVGGMLLLRNVPGVARLVRGNPDSSTQAVGLGPTYTARPPQTQTLTPSLTPALLETTPTPPPQPTATEHDLPTATADDLPAATVDDLPTGEPTDPSPTSQATPTFTPRPPTATPKPPTPTPSHSQWITFETRRGEMGDYEVYAMTPNGSRLVNLTNSWADDVAPVWSPNGRHIAFVSFRDTLAGKHGLGPGSIYVMDFDPVTGSGGNARAVTYNDTDEGWPAWAPGSQRVAFHSRRTGNWDIWVANLDGTGLVNLTNSPDSERFPAWSPDGKKIAFTSTRDGSRDIWVMNADGSDRVNLTNSPGLDRYAFWSPDSQKLTFQTERDGNSEIYMMNADGSNQTNITNAPNSTEGIADWSPNGKRLVLYSDRSGNKDVFILELATGAWTNITNHPENDEFCTWSP